MTTQEDVESGPSAAGTPPGYAGASLPRTKIVATIGPASEGLIGELIEAGLSVARINFSHGTSDEHRRRVQRVRDEAAAAERAVGVLVDLQGPKLRMGRFPGGTAHLRSGDTVRLRTGEGTSTPGEVLLEFEGFLDAVRPGERVLLADGQVALEVRAVEADALEARVVRGGLLGDRKGVHFPDSELRYEVPTPEDRLNLELAGELGADMVGVSFVGRADELRTVRSLAGDALIVAKIERMLALQNLKGILEATDGLMVARGDLGVEAELEQLPLIQKYLIKESHAAGRFSITATEMLESMVTSSRPTRAEVTDVANAVLDGTDAVMLSAETAVGQYPVEAVATMARVARTVEGSNRYRERPRQEFRSSEATFSNATAHAAVDAAEALGIGTIVCFTETGNTVRQLSRYPSSARIVALSPHVGTVNHMTALANVHPILFRREQSLEEMLYMACEMLVVRGIAAYGDDIVFVAGVPPGVSSTTNVMKLHRVGEFVRMH